MEQNKLMERNPSHNARMQLDPKIKDDLRSSHFSLGHAPIVYSSMSNSQFYDKSRLAPKHSEENGNMGHLLRKENYSMGNTKLDYKTETSNKFMNVEQKPEHR